MNDTPRPQQSLATHASRLLDRIEASVTPYDLFAICVTYMVFGHLAENLVDKTWLRTGDRILVPIFLISVGYNVGRKVDWKLATLAVLVSFMRWFMIHHWLRPLAPGAFSVLVTIVATRLMIEPLMRFALKSRFHFWGVNIVLAALAPYTNSHVAAYGTLGVLLAMAGWMARSRDEVPAKVVNVGWYFVALFCYYVAFNMSLVGFSALQLGLVIAGGALVFRLLYDMRRLLRTSLRRKQTDLVGRVCRFVGSNSLEIYALHMFVYYAIYYYAFIVPA